VPALVAILIVFVPVGALLLWIILARRPASTEQ
jgi:hypothetical protein